MQVILTKDVAQLGEAGEVVKVKAGYGSNYLIPQGLARLATPNNKRQLAHHQRQIEAAIVRERSVAEEYAKRLNGHSVTLTRIVGADEKDKIFGSVTTQDISDALRLEGLEVDRRSIILDAPLKALGVYDVTVKLHREVNAEIKVWVVAD